MKGSYEKKTDTWYTDTFTSRSNQEGVHMKFMNTPNFHKYIMNTPKPIHAHVPLEKFCIPLPWSRLQYMHRSKISHYRIYTFLTKCCQMAFQSIPVYFS